MAHYVALLRAVNVGGAKVSMTDLRRVGEEAGFTAVRTHLNSGNLLFSVTGGTVARHERELARRLEAVAGRPVPVVIRTPHQLKTARDAALRAFPDADEARVLIAFLDHTAGRGGSDRLGQWDEEEYLVDGDVVHLHYPHGQGRSKLTVSVIERALDVVATVRGAKTVAALITKSDDSDQTDESES